MLLRAMNFAKAGTLAGFVLLTTVAVARAEYETENGWNGHLFPSFIIATATLKAPEMDGDDSADDSGVLGDPNGLLGVTIEADADEQEVTVTISCDAIMEPSSITVTLPKSGESYTINPKIKYKYDQLAKRTQTGPVTVTYSVEVGENAAEEQTETLTLRSINDCPYYVDKGDSHEDVSYMFAAYVNEQHPFVDNVLREALNTGIVDSFTGYQAKDNKEVYRQVYALWHVLSKRDVRYSSITTSVAESDTVGSQHVRLIDESINNGQANCVDGSVLLASLLRKIGIEPILIMVPGHCYLAYSLNEKGTSLGALETTMIGSAPDEAVKIDDLNGIADEDTQGQNSWKTFTGATATGVTNLKKVLKIIEEKKDPNYQLISVVAARKRGILPIGFQANQKFVDAPKDDSGN